MVIIKFFDYLIFQNDVYAVAFLHTCSFAPVDIYIYIIYIFLYI